MMQPNDLKTWIEIAQSLVTILGIAVAGVWSYLTFLRGRSFAPNVQIQFELKQVINWDSSKGAVISVKIKNIGQTRVKKKNCLLTLASVTQPGAKNPLASTEFERLDPSFDEMMQQLPRQYEIFDEHTGLEPGEEATEDVLLELNGSSTFKVNAMFFGHRKQWSSNAILNMEAQQKQKPE